MLTVAVLLDVGYFVSQASHPVSARVAGATGAVSLTTHAAIGYRWQNTGSCPAPSP
ncbi:MAG: hypothetical protein SXV54_09900 [Chloroflexota bacterium]|nr:hypothetical protein [Chloroflexota bacterium]